MTTWTNDTTKDTCYPCHGIKAEATAPPSQLGTVGGLCYARCHGTDTGAAGAIQIDADYPEVGVWDNANRQLDMGTYSQVTVDKYGDAHKMSRNLMPAPDTSTMVQATGWPYTDCSVLQCTSCHDVHSNQFTPFLRANLYNATVANGFCERCHAAGDAAGSRWVQITVAPNGSHPTGIADWSTAAATRNNNGRRGRTIVLKDTTTGGTAAPSALGDNAVFRNLSPMGTTLNAAGPSTTANRYNPGGKLGVASGPTTLTGAIGCYTCHATHLPGAAGNSQLIVAKYKTLVGQSDLCVGCHGGNSTYALDNANVPGNPGVTPYFHPVEYDSRPTGTWTQTTGLATSTWMVSTGAFQITVNLDNTVAGMGIVPVGNTTRVLLCASCHTNSNSGSLAGVHNSEAGTMLLSPKKPTCESCHNTVAKVDGISSPNQHHVYGGTTNYTAAAVGGYTSPVPYNATQSAILNDGLQCNDCHVFNTTAHNW